MAQANQTSSASPVFIDFPSVASAKSTLASEQASLANAASDPIERVRAAIRVAVAASKLIAAEAAVDAAVKAAAMASSSKSGNDGGKPAAAPPAPVSNQTSHQKSAEDPFKPSQKKPQQRRRGMDARLAAAMLEGMKRSGQLATGSNSARPRVSSAVRGHRNGPQLRPAPKNPASSRPQAIATGMKVASSAVTARAAAPVSRGPAAPAAARSRRFAPVRAATSARAG